MEHVKYDRGALRKFVESEMEKRKIESRRQFADFVGTSSTTINRIFDNDSAGELSFTFILQLSQATNVYLLDLIAMIYPDIVRETTPPPSARVIAQQIQSLPPNMREAIVAFIMGAGKSRG